LGIEAEAWPSRDYFMWAVAVRDSATDALGMSQPHAETLHAIATHAVAGFHDDYQTLVSNADRNDLVLVPIRAAPAITSLTPSRVTLMGDAAHTMPPFGAHGANTALRDAQTLAAHLAKEVSSVEDAVRAYEADMGRYSRPLVQSALRMMTMATADFPLKRPIFRTVLRIAHLFSRS
jgi:2-polyprenyl-6-methoxyphenol hydroxylase-like FAD-dependent oxidoreductase